MLVTMKELLDHANEHNYAVMAPNIFYELDARSYIDLCNKLSKAFRDKYTDKHYIKDNWFTESLLLMI